MLCVSLRGCINENSLSHQKLLLTSFWSSCRSSWKVGMVSLIRRTVIKIALSHQNCIPFRFSYHEDHRAGYHAECLNRWNVMTPQKNSTFCNNMIFIHSMILPRYSMATAKNLLAYNSGEWWPLLPAQPQPKEPLHYSQHQHHLVEHCHGEMERNAEDREDRRSEERRVGKEC